MLMAGTLPEQLGAPVGGKVQPGQSGALKLASAKEMGASVGPPSPLPHGCPKTQGAPSASVPPAPPPPPPLSPDEPPQLYIARTTGSAIPKMPTPSELERMRMADLLQERL